MSFEVLEINKFSSDGEVYRRVRCLAGRVSVFRSQTDAEIEKYKAALSGISQEERFSVLLDGVQFQPRRHVFIGFGGDLDEKPSARSVANYLSDVGIEVAKIESILIDYSLGGLSQASCNDLSEAQWGILRLIRILHVPNFPWIVCLHNPFSDIPEKFRDNIAQKLTQCAWDKNGIVIVTKLSYRPPSWIENEHISRIQLERPRQGTIGFGGGDFSTPESISAIRQELGITEEPKAKIEPKKDAIDLLSTQRQIAKLPNISRRTMFYGGVAFCVLLIVMVKFFFSGSPEEIEIAQNSASSHSQKVDSIEQKQIVHDDHIVKNGKNTTSQIQRTVLNQPLGSLFPDDIRVAWIQAVRDPSAAIKTSFTASGSLGRAESGPTANANSQEQWGDSQIALPEELAKVRDGIVQNPGL